MAAKYQLITELYRRTGVAVAKNPQAWQSFLSAACRNYKCRFDEQLLIYAQRPDAVAVAQLETWNKQFKRWVNKDSKGIAVFDPKGRRNTLKYYFDISDTHEGYYGSRPVPIWQMSERYEQAVIERLSDRFGDVESTDLASVLMETAKNAVEDNLQDYMPQLKSCTQDSLLEGLDEYNIEVIYRQLAVNSVAYMLMSRCGVDTEAVFEREDFAEIINFNTPATINALGIATSDISEMALREISQTIRDVQIAEKSQNRTFAPQSQTRYDVGREQAERSNHNERNHIHQTRGLSYSRPNITDRARNSAWQIRFDAQGLSGAAQTSDLPQPADIGRAEQTSLRGGTDGSHEVGASDKTALQGAGRDGGTERKSTDAMGRADEQYPQSSGGNDTERADLQLNVADEQQVTVNLPTVEEQIEMLAEAEDEKSSAFVISQEDIDSVLQRGSGFQNGKYRIYRQFQKNEDGKSNIDFLKKAYGTGGGTHYFPDGTQGHTWHDGKGIAIEKYGSSVTPDLVLSWAKVEKRLRELIKNDRYLNEKEKDHYADYLESEEAPQYEIDTQRKMARQRFIDANRDLPPADKRDTLALRLSDFIRDLDHYEKDLLENVERTDLADVTAEQMEQHLGDPATVQQLIDFLALVQGKTADVYSRSNAWRFSQELMELYPLRYVYHEDDVVYIGADKYEIAAFDENAVSLRNPDFPLFGKELSRADFEEKLKENPANDHLKVVVTEKQTPHYTVELTSDAFADPFIIRDNTVPYGEDGQYYDVDGIYQTFETEEEAQEYADTLNSAENIVKLFAQKDEERSQQEQPDIQDNSDLIGKEILIDNRRYVIESISEISGDVSMRDMTFANAVGFPINRVEKIGYIRSLLSKAQEEKQPEKAVSPVPAPSEPRHNYRITEDTLGVGGAKEKFRNNMAAINLLHELELENRLATPEEQEILSKYVGWGGLSMAFDENNAAWADEFKELYASLSPEEYRAAMESTLTAFYTPPVVIKGMYEALERLGFSEGSILEPSCGTGNFFGLLPDTMAGSKLHGVEIDPLTGKIAKQLYQKANIAVQGFEETKLPDDHFDVVIGNVPFGDFKVNDSRYNAQKFLIHDYFFAKALDKVRAGGVVAFITSKGTMDKASPEIRKYIAQRAELLGAIRLPDNTFRANAGTEVTSDILFLQKRDRVIDTEPDWVHLDTDENGITMNSYFVQHPEMILGEMKMESTRFGFDSACKAYQDIPLSELLHNAVQNIQGEIPEYENELDEISDGQDASIPADPNVRNFSYALVDGKVYFRENDRMTPAAASVTAENRIKGLIQIRDCVRKLIEYQTEDYPDDLIRTEQENLNRLYDGFTQQYGLINSRGNYLAFASDESYFLLCSQEVLDDEGNFKRKADMFTKRTIKPHREITSVETASEALALSIGEKARVDLPYMEQLTGKPKEEIIKDLQGVIFRIPASEPAQYVTADEYLSGNVRAKLITAEAAAKENPEFAVNAQALRQVIPQDLSAAEISVRLGTTWIPQEDIQRFVMELLTPSSLAASRIKVRYTPINGDWFIENKSSDYGNVKADSTYGTKRASAYRIIEDTLNLRDTRIFDYVYDENGNRKAVFNAKETTAAQAKQEVIKQAFQDWIWKDPERRNRLVRYYNDTFNSVRPREYDGSHITFGGISPEITLRPHQVNAIAHILYGGNTLLAHKVGAGKTFEMVAAAQESKRLGLCNKAMFVVPNHLVGQWASEYLRLYPSANILVTRKQDFETGNRKKFCSRIATGDYDAVIIGHSQFEKIPMSIERQREQLERQLDDIERGIDDVKASKGEQFTVKQLMKTRKGIKTKLDKLNDTKRKDTVIDFEQLGIDRLFIDESHFYKNLYLYTKMRNVGGIAQTEAQKSSDLFMKCRYLDEITGNRGTVFATGTPISNSMVEMYSVQRYLQYDTLLQNGLQHFDSWASTFGETVTALELAPEGTNYRAKTRFAKFFNLPELMLMFREVADIQTADMLKLPVPKVNYHNIKTKPSEIQTKMVAALASRAEKVRARLVEPNVDNMLKITNDGRNLALDQRMIDPMLPDDPNSKVNACIDNVYRIWEEYADTKATQLVFCDLSTPKNDGTFNIYDDVREKLVARGVPAEQIRFIHEATSDAQKKELFAKVRSGEVRVLLGSTPKMGAGTNVQDRLIAIHNLDCPWRPSDLEQRQGRIERQGNMFPEVEVYRYVTEQTFDAYLYQLVESKQKFISQIMTSKSPARSAEDVDEVALSFAEVKMLATGDERFKEKMDLDIQVSKLKVLKQSYLSEHYDLEDRILKHFPQTIAEYEQRIVCYEADTALAEQHKPQGEEKFCPMTLRGISYTEKAAAGEMLLAICKEYPLSAPIEIGSYRGFKMEIFYDTVGTHYCLNLCGKAKYKVELGSDPLGNLTRIENELAKLPARLEAAQIKLAETIEQLETAKVEVQKPFNFEEELKEKSERLNALNIELNLDKKDPAVLDAEPEQIEEQPERKCTNRER